MEHDYQRQVDRACAAQSPSLLPERVDGKKMRAARERVEKQKSQYKVPASVVTGL